MTDPTPYLHLCRTLSAALIADGLDPTDPAFDKTLCQRLRLWRGLTQLIRTLDGRTVEVQARTQDEVPRWFGE